MAVEWILGASPRAEQCASSAVNETAWDQRHGSDEVMDIVADHVRAVVDSAGLSLARWRVSPGFRVDHESGEAIEAVNVCWARE